MKSIAIFNNKGGVGKTTLLCNLTAYLALERGKNILVIDADPQCNATQNLFTDDKVASLYDGQHFTIQSVIKPLATGRGYSSALRVERAENFGVDVLVGDPSLGLTEDLLATDWVQGTAGDVRGLRTTLIFSHLLEKCAAYDYVFFDMGPSLGSINRSVLLSCDYFVTPISLDIFSLKAIENIAQAMSGWKKRYEAGLGQLEGDLSELEVRDPTWHLRYAGYVTQQYTFKRDAEGEMRPVRAFEKIMEDVPGVVADHLPIDGIELGELDLGSIPTLHSLVPMSQSSRKPIFALQARDGVRGAHFSKVRDFADIIDAVSTRLLKNVGDF